MSEPVITVRALTADDAEAYRALRLEAVAAEPRAFVTTPQEEGGRSLEAFRATVSGEGSTVVYGVFADGALVGMAGYRRYERFKESHKALLWGVYVQRAWRGRGLSGQVVGAVVEHARSRVRAIKAVVGMYNEPARKSYYRLGFEPYGVERDALCVDGVYQDEQLIELDFIRARAAVS